MDLEAEAHKKKRELLVLGLADAYGDEMAVPKELEVDKDAPAPAAVALRLRVAMKVGAFFFPVGFHGSAPLLVCRFRSSRLFIFEARSLIPNRPVCRISFLLRIKASPFCDFLLVRLGKFPSFKECRDSGGVRTSRRHLVGVITNRVTVLPFCLCLSVVFLS